MNKRILVIGSLNIDIVVQMKNMPYIGETVVGEKISYALGGKGANQACAVGRLGGNVTMLGCIGDDEFGREQRKSLSNCNVNVSNLKISSGKPTGTAVICVNAEGDNSIVVIPGANKDCDIAYLKEQDELFEQSDFLLLQMEIPNESIYYAIKRAKELNKIVILNPAPAPDEIPEDILCCVDYLTPNETELMKISKHECNDLESMIEGAKILVNKGTKNVIVTLGEKGAVCVGKNKIIHAPARKVKAVDTTAAGDCFNGAITIGLSEGTSIEKAMTFANLASSISVTKNGAQNSIPIRNEVESIMK